MNKKLMGALVFATLLKLKEQPDEGSNPTSTISELLGHFTHN